MHITSTFEPMPPMRCFAPCAACRRLTDTRSTWLTEGVTFRTPREVLRFLYCHEWMRWDLREVLGRKSAAETAYDRFALRNHRRREVTLDDAGKALHRT